MSLDYRSRAHAQAFRSNAKGNAPGLWLEGLAQSNVAVLDEKVRVASADKPHARRACHERQVIEARPDKFPTPRFWLDVCGHVRSPTDDPMHADAIGLRREALRAKKPDAIRGGQRTRHVVLVLRVRRDNGAVGVADRARLNHTPNETGLEGY
jgi:hypothetical protein